MNKAIKLLIALILSLPALAQNTDSTKWNRFTNLFDNPYKKFNPVQIIGVQSNYMISSNRISNDFIYPFLFGKKIEKATINRNLKNNKNKQLSIESNNDVHFVNLKESLFHNKSLNWYLKGGTNKRTYINASNDAMKLIFKGNSESTIYKFSHCNYLNLTFNKIGGGIYHHVEKKAHPYNLSFGLFALQTQNYGKIKTYDRNYLQGNEDSFDLGVNYKAAFANKGLGMGSELIFNQKINESKTWGFSFQNFGFANFKEKATIYSANGNYRFDGVFISEINRLNEDGYFKNKLDSFTNPLTNKKENQTKTIWMAPVSSIYYNHHFKNGYYQLSLRHSGTKALPVAELRYSTFVKPSVLICIAGGTIGQNYLNTDIHWVINRHWFFQAAVYHIEALILPKTFGGLGGGLGLQAVF